VNSYHTAIDSLEPFLKFARSDSLPLECCCQLKQTLLVRPFLGRYNRLSSESRVDVRRNVQQFENVLLYRSEWREMSQGTMYFMKDSQSNVLKGLQHQLGRGPRRAALGISLIDTGQLCVFLGQTSPDQELKQGQDTQGNDQRRQCRRGGDRITLRPRALMRLGSRRRGRFRRDISPKVRVCR